MTVPLEESFAWCRGVTRRRARNFYYSFVLMRRAERDALSAVYAFMRYCDDVCDDCSDPAEARAALEHWRRDMNAALAGAPPDHPVWPAFAATVARYRIPHACFGEMIDGLATDLDPVEFRTFEDLYRYCYRVASVAGLCVVRILGYESEEALGLAEKCGVAFQLTNILRDVKEDAERGRVYFPSEDLERFGVRRQEILHGEAGPGFVKLMRFEAARARALYAESAALPGLVPARNRASLRALIAIYRRLLDRIEASGFDVFRRRISLSPRDKSLIVLRALVKPGKPGKPGTVHSNTIL